MVLEKMQVTHDPYFCLSVTLFRMTVTDYWRTFCFSQLPCSADKCIAVGEFVNCITCNMLNNDESTKHPEYFSGALPFLDNMGNVSDESSDHQMIHPKHAKVV